MIKIGLTGSIGMGKSTVLKMFADLGAAVWNADGAVHRLYGKGGAAVKPVAELFPQAVVDGAVNRVKLAQLVLDDAKKLKALEAIVHPLVAKDQALFLEEAAKSDAAACVLDIPLLFERRAADEFDVIIVVSAPEATQRERVLSRPDMTKEKLDAILAQQIPDAEKRARADYVISTAGTLAETRKQAEEVFKKITARFGR